MGRERERSNLDPNYDAIKHSRYSILVINCRGVPNVVLIVTHLISRESGCLDGDNSRVVKLRQKKAREKTSVPRVYLRNNFTPIDKNTGRATKYDKLLSQ